MTATTRLALLVLGLGLILGSALASPYPFGSKVLPNDIDFGSPLRSYLPSPNPANDFYVGYWETGVVNGYDDTDVVYLHQGFLGGPPAGVLANDVRLTPFGYLPAGSKVTPQDNDIGMPLIPMPGVPPTSGAIAWVNLYGGPGHDLDDPVYLHPGPIAPGFTPTRTNDVRLTAIGGNQPGTKVGNLDPDLPLVFAPLTVTSPNPITAFNPGLGPFAGRQTPISPAAAIRYVDINGNFQYDYPDDVYLITSLPLTVGPAIQIVSVNDLRLSGPVI